MLAPVVWSMSHGYEARCREIGERPSSAVRVGRVLGMVGTFLVIFEIAAFAILVVVRGVGGNGAGG
jgi:hypothetical protein